MAQKPPVLSSRVATGIAVVITIVWATSFLADIFIKDYDPSPFVHFLMMVVAGGAFGHAYIRNGKDSDDS